MELRRAGNTMHGGRWLAVGPALGLMVAVLCPGVAAQDPSANDAGRHVVASVKALSEASLQAAREDSEAGAVAYNFLLKSPEGHGELDAQSGWKPPGVADSPVAFEALHVKVYAGKDDRGAVQQALAHCLEEAGEALAASDTGGLELRVSLGKRGVATLQSGSQTWLLLVLRDGQIPECRLEEGKAEIEVPSGT